MRHDLDNDEALAHVEGRLRRMGIISALEAQGFEPGDDVEIAGVMFELHPGQSQRRRQPVAAAQPSRPARCCRAGCG